MVAPDINATPLAVGDLVVVLYGTVAEVGDNIVRLTLPHGVDIMATSTRLEKIAAASISAAITAAIPTTTGGGSMGAPGQDGEDGEPGAVGPTGPQGPSGAAGSTGPTGATGTAGLDGEEGPEGPQGPPGLTGPAGSAGSAGATGSQGPMGPAVYLEAEQGDEGMVGPPGIPPTLPEITQDNTIPAGDNTILASYSAVLVRKLTLNSGRRLVVSSGARVRIL